eukprot:1392356-Amorphochlora_amoeboformis.AAC.1
MDRLPSPLPPKVRSVPLEVGAPDRMRSVVWVYIWAEFYFPFVLSFKTLHHSLKICSREIWQREIDN